jgi:hypothetical protein
MPSKKDYEAIASIIKLTTIMADNQKVLPRNDFVNELCAYFKQDNSKFDTDRFREAVEPKYRINKSTR